VITFTIFEFVAELEFKVKAKTTWPVHVRLLVKVKAGRTVCRRKTDMVDKGGEHREGEWQEHFAADVFAVVVENGFAPYSAV
jgi:hypothetical protein